MESQKQLQLFISPHFVPANRRAKPRRSLFARRQIRRAAAEAREPLRAKMLYVNALDHDDFGLNQSKIMNVIDSNSFERDAGGKPASGHSAAILRPKGNKKNGGRSEVPAFPHPALALEQ